MAKSSRPERARSITKVVGRRLSSRCKSVAFRSFECKKQTKQTRLRVLVLSFPLFRLSKSDNLPRGLVLACGGRRRRGAANSTVFCRAPRGCSSAGRAPALQAGGQRFEPAHLHQHIDNRIGLMRSPECRKAISGSSF